MTKIEWTEKTWNPIAGCTRVSDGCRHCYAEVMARRLAAMGQAKYQGLVDVHGHWTGKISWDQKALLEPIKRNKPTIYFVNSMSDLFHENVTEEQIQAIFRVMAITPFHTYQILTKRPKRMLEWFNALQKEHPVKFNKHRKFNWPLPNVWLGVSVEDQRAANERIPLLLKTPAAVRFLSCEPLLGHLDLEYSIGGTRWIGEQRGCGQKHHGIGTPECPKKLHHHHDERCHKGIDWVIVGGESGHGAREMDPIWVRSLQQQCAIARVPFFFKQWGEYLHTSQITCDIRKHFSWNKWMAEPDEGFVRVGKKLAGRELDGQIWDEMPDAHRR